MTTHEKIDFAILETIRVHPDFIPTLSMMLYSNMTSKNGINPDYFTSSNNARSYIREIKQDDFLTIRAGVGNVPLKLDISYPEEHFTLDDDNLRAKYVELALQAIESTRDTDDIFTMHEADELLLFIDRNKKFQTKTMQDRFDEIGSYYLKIYSRGTKNLYEHEKRRFPDLYPDTYEEYYQQYLDGLWRD